MAYASPRAAETVTDESQSGKENRPSNPDGNGVLLLYLRLEVADLHDAPVRAVVQAAQANERPKDEEHCPDSSSKPHATSLVECMPCIYQFVESAVTI